MSYVSVRNLYQKYGNRPILERVNFEAGEGEFVSIVGASGCGKSTFLRLLLAQETPSKGVISIAGAEPAKEPSLDRGVVFQRYSVFPHRTVLQNLMAVFAMKNSLGLLSRTEKDYAKDEAKTALERIGLWHMKDQYPSALSGGMQQRLAIAQALLAKPKILLLDEPFGALDPGTTADMHEFLLELHDETKMSVFMVTHDLEEGFKLGNRLLVFDKPRWDPDFPDAYGATITFDLDTNQDKSTIDHIREISNVQ